jgi:hypothetical protein
MPEPKPDDVTFHEETDSSPYADDRKFYKVEKWTRDAVRWRVGQPDPWPMPDGPLKY